MYVGLLRTDQIVLFRHVAGPVYAADVRRRDAARIRPRWRSLAEQAHAGRGYPKISRTMSASHGSITRVERSPFAFRRMISSVVPSGRRARR